MIAVIGTPHLPFGALPAVVVALLAALAIGASVALHLLQVKVSRPIGWALVALRVVATCLAWLFVIAVVGRWLQFTTTWSLTLWSMIGGLAMESIIALYRFERKSVSRGMGMTLLALRLAMLAIVIFWLTQPIWYNEWSKAISRYVAVLIDDSASMDLVDKEATSREKLDLAPVFSITLPDRPMEFRTTARELDEQQQQFSEQLRLLELAAASGPGSSAGQLDMRVAKLKELADKASTLAAQVQKECAKASDGHLPLEGQTSNAIKAIPAQLKTLVDGPLARVKMLPVRSEDSATTIVGPLRDDVRGIIDAFGRLQTTVQLFPAELDNAYWRSLPEKRRQEIDQTVSVARSDIARRTLDLKDKDGKSLVKALQDGYELKFYHFDSKPVAIDSRSILGDTSTTNAEQEPKASPEEKTEKKPPVVAPAGKIEHAAAPDAKATRAATDLAAALKMIAADGNIRPLSGVLAIWDGRHNVDDSVAEAAGSLAAQQVPVSTVLIGSRNVPKDAAVANLELPDTVLQGDKLSLKAALKIDGFRGQDVVVKLLRGDKEVDQKTIKVPEDHHRSKVEFSQPTKELGFFDYRVVLSSPGGAPLKDVVPANDSASRQVSVSDDRIKVLLVESKPRWEFRYIKNLFAGPDKRVQLQFMLTDPTKIEGAPPVAPVHVSASRPYGTFEGTALPENELEWMKFDVIILGDVSPEVLGKNVQHTLEKFVSQRGGTLVVIAGPDFMPHAYADKAMSDMLPFRYSAQPGSMRQPPDAGYQLHLTAEGKEHVLMRQAGTENEAFWRSVPTFRWRHPDVQAKEGASVLAYAESAYQNTPSLPDTHKAGFQPTITLAPSGVTMDATKAVNRGNDQLERENALICWQRYGAGKVLMLNFDETWRLRYRVGVAHHHRFWGGVVRWAAEDKLPAGTPLVRLGTDRPRYEVGQQITIKARLIDEKASPVIRDDVVAKVFAGQKLLHTVALSAEPGGSGRYRGELAAKLDTGILRIELAGPSVEELVARNGGGKVETEFGVGEAAATSELVELTADDAVPAQVAALTGGRVVAPADAGKLVDAFGAKSGKVLEKSSLVLWDSWPVLLMFLLFGSAEWICRKKAGLT